MRRLIVVFLLIACLLALPLLVMRSERALVFLAHWAVGSFTDFRLVLREPQLKPLKGFATAQEIHLYPGANDAPPLLSVIGFSSKLKVADLYSANLRRSHLQANQVVVYTSDRGTASEPAPMEWLQYLSWLPGTLRIEQLHVVRATEAVDILRLDKVSGQRGATATFAVTAQANDAGEPLAIDLQLQAAREQAQFNSLTIDATFTVPNGDSRVALTGELRGTQQKFTYDLHLDAHYREISRFLGDLNAELDLAGALDVTATMRGDASGYTLSDARFMIDNMPDYGVEAVGSLHYARGGDSSLSLVAAAEIDTASPLLARIPLDIQRLGRAQANARISGSLLQPTVERFLLRSENADGLVVNLMGQLQQGSTENRLEIDLGGPDLSALSHWTGPLPHATGPFRASGVISGTQDALLLDNLIVEAGSRRQVYVRIEGRAQSQGRFEEQGLAAIKQAELDLSITAPDSSHFSPFWTNELPGGFEISGLLQLQGTGAELEITGGKLSAASSDILLTVVPTAGRVEIGKSPPFNGLAAEIAIDISDTSALSQFVDFPVPVLGAVRGAAAGSQHADRISLEDIELTLTDSGRQLTMTGAIDNVATLGNTRLKSRFSGIEARDLLMTGLQDFDYAPVLGTLDGSFLLRNDGSAWSLEAIELQTADKDGALSLTSRGRIGTLLTVPAINLETTFGLRDPELLDALTGLRMNPASGQLSLRSSGGSTQFNGSSRVGSTQLTLDGKLEHSQGHIDSLTAKVASPALSLDDLGLQAKRADATEYRPSEQIKLQPGERLTQALQRAPAYKTDITLDLMDIIGEQTNIQRFNLHYTGEQQRYTLRRFTIAYGDSTTEIRGIIDLNSRPAFVSLAGEANALPLSTLTQDLGIDLDVSGRAFVRGGLSSQGASGEALLANLDGSLSLALEDAVIEGAAYDVLATDLLAWFYSGAAMEKSTHIDCTMAQFIVEGGVVSSDSLYIETEKMVATGNATLNLGKQKMDVTLTPRSKSRSLQVPSSIRLKGDFNDPRVILSPVAAAVDAYAEVLTLVPRIAGRIFGIKKKKKAAQPCVTVE